MANASPPPEAVSGGNSSQLKKYQHNSPGMQQNHNSLRVTNQIG